MQVDLKALVPLLRKSIDSGCHAPRCSPVYTKHCLIAMPRYMTDDELVEMQLQLDLLPCQAVLVENFRGTGHDLKVYELYQG